MDWVRSGGAEEDEFFPDELVLGPMTVVCMRVIVLSDIYESLMPSEAGILGSGTPKDDETGDGRG